MVCSSLFGSPPHRTLRAASALGFAFVSHANADLILSLSSGASHDSHNERYSASPHACELLEIADGHGHVGSISELGLRPSDSAALPGQTERLPASIRLPATTALFAPAFLRHRQDEGVSPPPPPGGPGAPYIPTGLYGQRPTPVVPLPPAFTGGAGLLTAIAVGQLLQRRRPRTPR